MSFEKIETILIKKLHEIESSGRKKGNENIITKMTRPFKSKGARYYIEGYGNREFIRMNSNSYLGLHHHPDVLEAETKAGELYGTGPGAVRFISGTFEPHIELEKKLAAFHKKEAAMIFSSAYSAVMGIIPQLVDDKTVIINDELNHNSIINGTRLSRPLKNEIYKHCDIDDLEEKIKASIDNTDRIVIITDGIFSMRGDHGPLDRISSLAEKYDSHYKEGIIIIVDDSHGVGAFGSSGRGTVEYTGASDIDLIISTLGKALGVNGGYVVSNKIIIDYLKETSPLYIYTNPITPSEAAAALKALEILDSQEGFELIRKLNKLTGQFERGLLSMGLETIQGDHPIVPLITRDTDKTNKLVSHLFNHDILATGIKYPVVPKNEDEIRFQISADHSETDIDYVLQILEKFYNGK